MNPTEVRPVPWIRVLRNQIGLLWSSRAALIVVALAVSVFAVLEVSAIQQEASRLSLIERGRPTGLPLYTPGIWEVHAFTGMILPILWVALIWRGEAFDQRRYHWAMPVDQRAHDLARVVAGGLWLLAAIVAVVLCSLVTYWGTGRDTAFIIGIPYWISLFTVALLTYAGVSILPIVTSRPIGWGVALWVVLVGLILVFDEYASVPGAPDLMDLQFGGWGPDAAWVGAHRVEYPIWDAAVTGREWRFGWGGSIQWWIQATILWMGLAASGVLLAVRRRP